MAGILDQKSRILDVLVTQEGKRQMINGGMQVKFVSFSDIGSIYSKDEKNIFEEPSINLNLESFSTQNDFIFPYTDENGKMFEFVTQEAQILNGGLTLRTNTDINSSYITIIDDSNSRDQLLSSIKDGILSSYKNQQIISTKDGTKRDKGLSVDKDFLEFSIFNGSPFDGEPEVTSLSDADSLFADKRLSKSKNFKYLPPIQYLNKTALQTTPLGKYTNLSEKNDLGSDFRENLKKLESKEINFSKLTDFHDIAIQFFETSGNFTKKLDIIKYGEKFFLENNKKSYDLYFIGKVFFDEFNVATFINIFTVFVQ